MSEKLPPIVSVSDITKKPYLFVIPPNEKILEFWKSPAKYKVLLGGNRSGKTENCAIEVIWHLLGEHPFIRVPEPPVRWRIHLVNFTKVKEVIQEKFAKYLPASCLWGNSWRTAYNQRHNYLRLKNGSTITFTTQRHSIRELEGASLHGIWIDEECPEEQFRAMRFRLLDTDGKILVSATPLDGITWLYELVERSKEDPNYFVQQVSVYENKYIDKDVLANLEKVVTEQEKDVRLYGKMLNQSRRVFSGFDEMRHIVDINATPPANVLWAVGLDWGWRHNSALVYACKLDDVVYVVDEFVIKGLPLAGLGDEIFSWCMDAGIPPSKMRVVYDAQLKAVDTNGQPMIKVVSTAHPFRLIPSTKREDSVAVINDMFRNGKIYVSSNCQRLIDGLKHFYYRNSMKAMVDDENKDICDAFRYVAYYLRMIDYDEYEEENDDFFGAPSGVTKIMDAILEKRNANKGNPYLRRW